MATIVVSLSSKAKPKKSKAKKSPRARFLSAMMKKFGGEFGARAAEAFDNKDSESLHSVFADVASSLAEEWDKKAKSE
jgi:hypothetical protein